MMRHMLGDHSLRHVFFETTDLERSTKFYSQALGLVFIGEDQEEHFFGFPNHQLIGLKAVELVIGDRKSTRLNSSHVSISYAVFCLKKKKYLIYSCAWATDSSTQSYPITNVPIYPMELFA